MDRALAEEFTKRIELAFAHMEQAAQLLRDRLDEDDLRAFAERWSQAIGELDLGVLELIYRAHPDLRPEGMTPTPPLSVIEASCARPPAGREDAGE